MDLTFIGYLLFVIPGFCFVWTYRHFTKAEKIGDFEYAIWSFLFGSLIFLAFGFFQKYRNIHLPLIPLDNESSLIGALLGTGLGLSISLSFPFSFIFIMVSYTSFFKYIDKKVFKFLYGINKYFN